MGILYLGSLLALWLSVLLVRKSSRQENLLVWAVISFMLMLCIQAFTCGVIGLLGIGITLLSAGLLNFLTAAGLGWLTVRKGIQLYRLSLMDLIAVGFIVFLTYRFALHHYGVSLDANFVSVDAAIHAKHAREVALEHRLPISMYFAALPTGLMMSAWSSLTGMEPGAFYKVFIVCEMVYLALSPLMLWAVIRESCGEGWIRRLVPMLCAPVYWIVYPAYSTIFGFSYFGISICILTLLVFLLKRWFGADHSDSRIWIIIGLNLALFSIFVCYTLFVPVAFFGTLAALGTGMTIRDRKKVFSKRNLLTCLAVFLVPTVLGMLYSSSHLRALNAAPGSAGIQTDGGCYADLYSNFIPLVPFALIGVYFVLKKGRWQYILPFTAVQFVLAVIFFIGVWHGKVSAYYYVRNNNLIWLLMWILTAEGILGMADHCRVAALFPLLFWGILYMGLMGDYRVELKNSRMIESGGSSVFDLVYFDKAFYEDGRYIITDEHHELYAYINSNCAENRKVVCIGPDIPTVWFKACTGRTDTMIYGSQDELKEMLGDATYLCAMYGDTYEKCKPCIDTLETVFENSKGKILRVN